MVASSELRRIVREAPADAGLLDDLAELRGARVTRPRPARRHVPGERRRSRCGVAVIAGVARCARLTDRLLDEIRRATASQSPPSFRTWRAGARGCGLQELRPGASQPTSRADPPRLRAEPHR